MNYAILPILLTLSACGPNVSKTIDVAFSEYVSKWEEDTGLIVNIGISFVEGYEDDNRVGQCTTWFNGAALITIHRGYWEEISDIERYALLLHELGHCVMGKDHNDTEMSDRCPASLMNSYILSERCYLKHYDALWEEYLR